MTDNMTANMAKNRKRRLRKKLHLGEFQELGFDVSWRFAEGTDEDTVDETIDRFIAEVIDANKLAFAADGSLQWDGLICTEIPGQCTDEQRKLVQSWLEANGMLDIEVSPLFDLWYGTEA